LIFKNEKLDGVTINVDSDKAKSAKVKIEEWKIPKDEIVVVVDGANDIKLFDICNLGIAYRAQDLVKELATITLEEKDLTKIIPIINQHYSIELPIPVLS
jgi:phosphoserine phosphatase